MAFSHVDALDLLARDPSLLRLPPVPEVLIEQPRFSMVKRRADQSVDFISPLPCPYNYGCIPERRSGDGDALDAVLLGPRLPEGTRVTARIVAVVGFVDNGQADPKVICSNAPVTPLELRGVVHFFELYALAKRMLGRLRKEPGPTCTVGLLPDAMWTPSGR